MNYVYTLMQNNCHLRTIGVIPVRSLKDYHMLYSYWVENLMLFVTLYLLYAFVNVPQTCFYIFNCVTLHRQIKALVDTLDTAT